MRVYYAATSSDQPMKVFSGEYYAATSTDQPMKVFSGEYYAATSTDQPMKVFQVSQECITLLEVLINQ